MVYDGIVLSLLIGWFRGGSLKGLANMKLRFGWLFPILLAVQFVVFFLQERVAWISSMSNGIFLLVYITGLAFLWLNRHQPGFPVIFAGVLLNFSAMRTIVGSPKRLPWVSGE